MTNQIPGTFIKKEDIKLALVRCPECHQENYAMNVISGICTWCGYDANAKDDKEQE